MNSHKIKDGAEHRDDRVFLTHESCTEPEGLGSETCHRKAKNRNTEGISVGQ